MRVDIKIQQVSIDKGPSCSMVSGFTIKDTTSTHHHICYVFHSGHCEMYLIYLHIIKFVTDFRHIGGFLLVLRCPQHTTQILLFIQLVTFCVSTPSTFNL